MRDVHINECMNHYFELDLFIFLHSFFEDWPVQFSFCPLWKYIRVSDDKNFIFGLSISLSNTTGMMSMIPGEMGRKLLWFKKKKKKLRWRLLRSACLLRGTFPTVLWTLTEETGKVIFPISLPNNPFLHSLKHQLSSIILLSLFSPAFMK